MRRRDSDLLLIGWEQRGLISIDVLEGGETCRSRRKSIVGVFHPGELVAPWPRVLGHEAPEAGLEVLLYAFCLAIGLGVVAGRQADGGA